MTLTSRDDDILRTLALSVRMLSLAQVARTWWMPTPAGQANARRRLAVLADSGLLRSAHVHARPLPELAAPVLAWTPAQADPDFDAVSWALQSRWTKAPRRILVYIASRHGANQYGGRLRGQIKHELQATHDLGVAEVYLHFRTSAPDKAIQWTGEDTLRLARKRRQKIPDAVLRPRKPNAPPLVIEFGGAYDARRVRSFHRDCAERKLSYEIW